MSKFVNYTKRSVTLPRGCKDLVDALRRGPDPARSVTPVGCVRGKLSEIERYVKRAMRSRAFVATLTVNPPDQSLIFDLVRMSGEPLSTTVVVQKETPREAAIRDFFARHDLQPPEDSSTPQQFCADVPVHIICRILPMPCHTLALSKLVTELFREVCGLTYASEMHYRYDRLVFD